MRNNYGKGWRNEPLRHSLARKGVKTGRQGYTPKPKKKYSLLPIEKELGGKIVDSYDSTYGRGRYYSLDNDQEFLVFDNEEDAYNEAVDRVREDLEKEPELFNQEWLESHVDEERLRDEMTLTLENDSGEYDLFTEEEKPKTDEDYEKFGEWVERKVDDLISSGEYQEYGFEKINYVDLKEASEDAVNIDGTAHFLSYYDGKEIQLKDGKVAYRKN